MGVKMYKGFDKDLQCRGFQYEIGKIYEADKAELCKEGFHACENPLDVFNYYAPGESRYCEVELDDVSDKRDDDTKRVGKRIKIGAELGIKGMVDAAIKIIFEKVNWQDKAATNTGDYSAATNTGDRSAATNTGYRSAATNTGDYSAATNTGYCSAATNTGKEGVAIALGANSKAKGALGCWLVVAEWKSGHRINVISAKVDNETIKPDTWYTVKDGKFVEWEDET